MFDLFLKNEKVLTLKEVEGVPVEIKKIDNKELLPICLQNECTIEKFNDWFEHRSIPKTRDGLKKTINMYGDKWLKNRNYFSLTDQYWIKRTSETWNKTNFFTKSYTTTIGDILFYPEKTFVDPKRIYNVSPDLTTNGVVKKRWKQIHIKEKNFKSYLIKAASERSEQKPLNEVLASRFVERIGKIKSAGYDLYVEQGLLCSICENFIDENTELVTAVQIYNFEKKDNSESILNHILKMCDKFDIPDAEEFIRWMTYIDYYTGNEDRNLSNIGFIRDINTMKFIGPAPLYDCGNAYWCGKTDFKDHKAPFLKEDEKKIIKELSKENTVDLAEEFKKCEEYINNFRYMDEPEKNAMKEHIHKHYEMIKIKEEIEMTK